MDIILIVLKNVGKTFLRLLLKHFQEHFPQNVSMILHAQCTMLFLYANNIFKSSENGHQIILLEHGGNVSKLSSQKFFQTFSRQLQSTSTRLCAMFDD